MNPYRAIFQALNDANIRYLVVGGVAVNLHGYSRYTGDLDIVMTLDAENLARMDKLMQEKGYVQRPPRRHKTPRERGTGEEVAHGERDDRVHVHR